MKTKGLTPTKLRVILSLGMFVIAGAGVGLFTVAYGQLSQAASNVSKTATDEVASRNSLRILQNTQAELNKQREIIARIDSIAANSQSYSYQNQIIGDMSTYAARAGITITNIDFASGSVSSAPAASTVPAAPTIPAAPAAGSTVGSTRTATIAVTLNNPVEYTKLLDFFNMIEQSTPKLQVSKVNLSKVGGGVSSEVLNIEIYIR